MDAAANSYRRFLDGDESAFEEIMQELFCGLVFFINGFVHDPHAAEDIAIDAFSDLVVHRHRYNFRVSLKTYLYMVGRSRALDYLRRRRILRFTELSEAHGLADDSAALEELALAGDRQRPGKRRPGAAAPGYGRGGAAGLFRGDDLCRGRPGHGQKKQAGG